MKRRLTVAFLFLAALIWIVLGLLYLIRLHDWFKGSAWLALGLLSLFIAVRFRRRAEEIKGVSLRT